MTVRKWWNYAIGLARSPRLRRFWPVLFCALLSVVLFVDAGVRNHSAGLWVRNIADAWDTRYLAETDHLLLLPVRLIYPDGLISSYPLYPHSFRLWDWAILLVAETAYLYLLWLILRRPLRAGYAAWKRLPLWARGAVTLLGAALFVMLNLVERERPGQPVVSGWPLWVLARDNDVIMAFRPHLPGLAANAIILTLVILLLVCAKEAIDRWRRREASPLIDLFQWLRPSHPARTSLVVVGLMAGLVWMHSHGYKLYGSATLIDNWPFGNVPQLTAVTADGEVALSDGSHLQLTWARPLQDQNLSDSFWSAERPLLVHLDFGAQSAPRIMFRQRKEYPAHLLRRQVAPPRLPQYRATELDFFLLEQRRALPVLRANELPPSYYCWLANGFPQWVPSLTIPPEKRQEAASLAREIVLRYPKSPQLQEAARHLQARVTGDD